MLREEEETRLWRGFLRQMNKVWKLLGTKKLSLTIICLSLSPSHYHSLPPLSFSLSLYLSFFLSISPSFFLSLYLFLSLSLSHSLSLSPSLSHPTHPSISFFETRYALMPSVIHSLEDRKRLYLPRYVLVFACLCVCLSLGMFVRQSERVWGSGIERIKENCYVHDVGLSEWCIQRKR